MFNTSTTLLQSKKYNPKHFTSIVGIAATLIPFRIVVINDEKETTMRIVMEQPCHLLQFFITSSYLSLLKLLPQLTCFPWIFLPSFSFANQCLSNPCCFRSYSSLISSIEHLCE
ncbi:unnamed protein product [Lactuca saligna]|uniref:Uncharacterized protein n=1 Tax=Lactuca saligna TaxID=75948 RepID=A0AA35YUF3_LACSI|nr:unnamed protein product [Lactuca saligna]